MILASIPDNIHIYLRKSKNKHNFHLNKIQYVGAITIIMEITQRETE